jgi:hypothetical protein
MAFESSFQFLDMPVGLCKLDSDITLWKLPPTILVFQARPLLTQALEDGNFEALLDPRLGTRYNNSEMASMVACAAACVHPSSWIRPRMSQVTSLPYPVQYKNYLWPVTNVSLCIKCPPRESTTHMKSIKKIMVTDDLSFNECSILAMPNFIEL